MKESHKNIFVAFILNIGFSIFELIGGFLTNSIAILSDSIHDFADGLSIGMAYFLEKKSKKKPNEEYTYGYLRYSVLGSIITTSILVGGSLFVIYNSIKRLINPVAVNYNGMIIMAILGVVVNFLATYYTKGGHSLNQKSVNLHMLEDVLGWIVVLIGSILMKFTSIKIIDPILSLGVALFILYHCYKNIKEIGEIFLEKTPHDIDIEKLKKELLQLKGIEDIHHIHLWTLDGANNFATLHAVVKKYNPQDKMLIRKKLGEFNIKHSTIEIELEDEECFNTRCKIDVKSSSHHHHH